ncbi:DEAD/DEAH box helicase, partial [bacterium]|nr:DEAD/DEAH box helicase [bacterium]
MWVNSVSIPVRELVSNYYLSGDLGMDFMSPARAREGTRIHTKIQKSRPENYVSEVGISDCIYEETVELEVTGRIDGVYIYDDKVIIDEIKTTYLDLDILEANPKKTHLGQLKCYAYMYAKRNDIKHIHLQLTYYNMNSKEIRELSWECTIEELQSFFLKLVESFLKPLKSDIEWKKKRNESARLLQFPHPIFREHQREMAIWIYRTIVNQEQLLIQAPTGTGKTIASLFPAVKSFGEEKISRIFYLAARTTGKEIAENSIKAMRKAGLKLRSIILTAKEKICFNPDCKCDALECEYAKGYYDRIQAAVDEARTHQCYDRGYITSVARKHVVCPFEFSLDLTLIADCIICDYNYAFDPRVFLKRFFIDNSGNYTFLIDEAHNLVERARSMFSAELDKQEFLEARMPVKKTHKDLYKILGNINKWFLEKKKSSELSEGYYSTSDQPDDFYILINAFMFEFEDLLTSKMNQPRNFAELLELYFKV